MSFKKTLYYCLAAGGLALLILISLLCSACDLLLDEFTGHHPHEQHSVPTEGTLIAHFIDVGQGDAILIQASGYNLLIDGGSRSAGPTVVSYLENLGLARLDLVILTHPHEDHVGGLIRVLQDFQVDEVIDPAVMHTTNVYEEYLTIIDQQEIPFTEGRAGMTRDLEGGASLQILHPSAPSSSHLNDASIVAKIVFGQISLLLTGDLEQPGENQILDSGYNPESTILKIGHHGSNTGSSEAFLIAVDPEVAIIMCGDGNRYGHPHEETLQKLAACDIDVYRTDLHGTIIITTDGRTYSIDTELLAYRLHPRPPSNCPGNTLEWPRGTVETMVKP